MSALDRYTCLETVRRLDDYLDRELTAEETRLVEEHLRTCDRCLRKFQFDRSVVEDIRAKLRRVPVPSRLRAAVIASLRD